MNRAHYLCWICLLICSTGFAQGMEQLAADAGLNEQQSDAQVAPAPSSLWQFGGFIDAAYLLDFNHPASDLFRSRGTTYKLDEPLINMAALYLQKNTSEASR